MQEGASREAKAETPESKESKGRAHARLNVCVSLNRVKSLFLKWFRKKGIGLPPIYQSNLPLAFQKGSNHYRIRGLFYGSQHSSSPPTCKQTEACQHVAKPKEPQVGNSQYWIRLLYPLRRFPRVLSPIFGMELLWVWDRKRGTNEASPTTSICISRSLQSRLMRRKANQCLYTNQRWNSMPFRVQAKVIY